MPPFHESIKEYKKQLEKGEIQEAKQFHPNPRPLISHKNPYNRIQ